MKNVQIESLKINSMSTLKHYKLDSAIPPHGAYFHKTEARMLQLRKYHMISQGYVLPIPYLCQVYHLLNLKHLEQVHSLSLKGLKVNNVSQFEETKIGGIIKFQTTLAPSVNLLKIWRKTIVEAELTLHTPYTIELSIPIYSDRRIVVIFNMLPLGSNTHKLFIDIYSNLICPKPVLQIILHCASCLTLFEDLPYLDKLASKNLHSTIKFDRVSNNETMQLFKRFVDLYGSIMTQPQSTGAVELRPLITPSLSTAMQII
jgi:hypothetical protein